VTNTCLIDNLPLTDSQKKRDEMQEVVICPECKKEEYTGMIHWRDGHRCCRNCIYEIWAKDSNYKRKPSVTDFVFSLYDDGKDYRKEVK